MCLGSTYVESPQTPAEVVGHIGGFSLFLIDELAPAYIASLYFETVVRFLVLLSYSHRIPPNTSQKGGKATPKSFIFWGGGMQIDIMGNSILGEIENLKI